MANFTQTQEQANKGLSNPQAVAELEENRGESDIPIVNMFEQYEVGAGQAAPYRFGYGASPVPGSRSTAEAQRAQMFGMQARGLGAEAWGAGRGAQSRDLRTDAYAAAQNQQYGARNQQAMMPGFMGDSARSLYQLAQRGPGPSAAQAQLAAGSDAAMRANLSMARSGNAGTSQQALRDAAFANAAQQGQLNQQAGLMRAQEEQAWRQQQAALLGASGQMYGAMNDQYSAMRGQDLQALALENQRALGQGQLNDAYQLGLYDTAGSMYGLGLEQDSLAHNIYGTQLSAAAQMELANAGAIQRAQIENARLDLDRDASALGMVGGAIGAFNLSDRTAKRDIEAMDSADFLGLVGAGLGGYSRGSSDDRMESSRRAGEDIAGGLMRLSDERSKSNIHRLREENATLRELASGRGERASPMVDAAKSAHGYWYRYRDPERHGPGLQAGVMAQDLERTPVGRTLVQRGPDGLRRIDAGKAALVGLSATGEVAREQESIEERLARLEALAGGAR